MRVGRWGTIVAAAMLVPAVGKSALAQEVVRAPDQIRECLCREQSVAALNSEVQAQSRLYDDQRQAFQQLDKDVQSARPRVNVSNKADVDSFKRLLERRDAAADSLAGDVTRNYADAVTRYNRAVVSYNASCAGKAYDPDQLAELRRSLSCPKP